MAEGVQGPSKITVEDCKEIRMALKSGHSCRKITEYVKPDLDVSDQTIRYHGFGECACPHQITPASPSSNRGPIPFASDEEIIEWILSHEDPCVSTGEVANQFHVRRRGVYKRLLKMRDLGILEGKDVGPGIVWWVSKADTLSENGGKVDE